MRGLEFGGLEFGVWGLPACCTIRPGIWDLGFRVQGSGFGVWGLEFGGLDFEVWSLEFGVRGVGF